MSELARLRWQCRRGRRELDVLLEDYLDRAYAGAGPQRQAAFRALLDLPNPQLLDYLLGRASPPTPALDDILEQLRRRP